jgi:hypothetical protein
VLAICDKNILFRVEEYEKRKNTARNNLEGSMKILLSIITSKRVKLSGPAGELIDLYLDRATHYVPCSLRTFPSEAKLLDFLAETSSRTRPILFLADSRGQQLSSEDLAVALGAYQDCGTQQLFFAM